MRIRNAINKTIYIIAGEAVVFSLNIFLFLPYLGSLLNIFLVTVLNFAYVFIGARTFRAANEEVTPPRAWWRATGRPLAGFIIGGGFALLTLSSLYGALRSKPEFAGLAAVACVSYAVFATFYLHSSFRLRGEIPPEDEADEEHEDR